MLSNDPKMIHILGIYGRPYIWTIACPKAILKLKLIHNLLRQDISSIFNGKIIPKLAQQFTKTFGNQIGIWSFRKFLKAHIVEV